MKTKLALSILLLTLFFSFEKGNAQAPGWAWAKSAGGTNNDQGNSITTDASGNVLVTGYFSGPSITFGTTTLTTAGGSDFYVVKYDASGNVLWAKSAGGTASDYGKGVCTDASGNVLVTGSFNSASITFGTTTLTNTASFSTDIFIVKYDAGGNMLWAKSSGGISSDLGTGIACDASGNVVVTGYFQSASITFGTTTLSNSGSQDIFVVKYDAAGNSLWAKSQGGVSYDNGYSICTDTTGNVLVTGYFQSPSITFGTTTLINNTSGSTDIFVAKYDASGNVLWAKSAGGTLSDNTTGITADASGNVIVTGYFQSNSITFGTITLNNIGSLDIFVVKYDASGNVLWAKSAGGGDSDYGYGISTDASGSALVTGSFASPSITFGTTTLTNSGQEDIFVVKYDAAGNVAAAKSATGADTDIGYAISTDASGNAFVTGRFASPSITFDTTALTNAGSIDIFVSKLTFCATTATVNAVACYSYTSPSGNYNWTTSGIYHDTLTNVAGCDSIITVNLTINTVDTSVSQIDNSLTANATPATYQWLDCDSGFAPITGETFQFFAPLVDGSYAVAITQNGCTDTSSCYLILGTGINQLSIVNFPLSIFPNPATDYITINTGINKKQVITITDITGKIIYSTTTLSDKTIINTKDFPQGVYAVQVQAGDAVQTSKVVVTR